MPSDATTQNALIIIAIAVSVQTALMAVAIIAIVIATRRANAVVDQRLAAFADRMDELAAHTRVAVEALDRCSVQVGDVMHDTGRVVRTLTSAVTGPRSWLMAGAASAATRVLSRWLRGRQDALATR
jgi:hypothetical protein